MYAVMLVIHILICIALVISVLLQSAKGEGLAGAFGGSSLTGTVFGGRGAATFLSKATTVLAITFMSSCIILTFLHPSAGVATAVGGGTSAVEEAVRGGAVPQPAPAVSQPAEGGTGQPPVSPDEELFQTQPAQQPATEPAGEGQPAQPSAEPEGGGGQ